MALGTPIPSYSPIKRLDVSNDYLLQEYYNLYYNLPENEEGLLGYISLLIDTHEKIKLGLKGHLFNLKNNVKTQSQSNILLEFIPLYLKLESLMKNKMHNSNEGLSFKKGRENIKLYFEILYNQDISSGMLDKILQKKEKTGFHIKNK